MVIPPIEVRYSGGYTTEAAGLMGCASLSAAVPDEWR